jgi:hypothetical protein
VRNGDPEPGALAAGDVCSPTKLSQGRVRSGRWMMAATSVVALVAIAYLGWLEVRCTRLPIRVRIDRERGLVFDAVTGLPLAGCEPVGGRVLLRYPSFSERLLSRIGVVDPRGPQAISMNYLFDLYRPGPGVLDEMAVAVDYMPRSAKPMEELAGRWDVIAEGASLAPIELVGDGSVVSKGPRRHVVGRWAARYGIVWIECDVPIAGWSQGSGHTVYSFVPLSRGRFEASRHVIQLVPRAPRWNDEGD